jgi:dinuclear metal center YbgI/SA1388 family protein
MTLQLSEIIFELEKLANPSLQESYDNSGLILGNPSMIIKRAIITLDVTEKVMDEAIRTSSNLIIAHHPIIFGGLKKITGNNYVEKCVIKAIKNDIAIYAIHTNLDNIIGGTNSVLANKLGLKNLQVLTNSTEIFKKLVTYCPVNHVEKVRNAIFEAGAGHIGNYDCCSYNSSGKGSFRANEKANPFVGEIGQIHFEEEIRIETIFPTFLEKQLISALLAAHPYEEVAYDIFHLDNTSKNVGAGIVGDLETEEDEMDFLGKLKLITKTGCIKHTDLRGKMIRRVAICGGSGAFLIKKAKQAKADIYITGDIKYHEFFDAENQIILADIGHYESENFIKELLISYINEKFPTFAVLISEENTNPVNYL